MGYGSVYKLSGNRRRPWVARITTGWSEDKRQLYKVLGYFKTRKEAQIALAEYNKDPFDVDLRKLTFKEVYERWASEHHPKISQSKRNAYKTVFNQSAEIHDTPLFKLKTSHLQKLINDKSHLKSSTLGHHKSCYSQLFNYAMKHEIVNKNYAEFIDIPKSGDRRSKKPFTAEEIERLFLYHQAGEEGIDVILMLLYTGFRVMELLSMKKSDVYLADRYMIGGFKSEAGTNRVVPINRKIAPLIEARMNQGDSEYLIPTPQGCKWLYQNYRTNVWVPMMKRLGMEHTAHDTRHTFISMMSAAGVDKIVIQRIAGHSNRDITDHYTHLEIRRLIEAIDMI